MNFCPRCGTELRSSAGAEAGLRAALGRAREEFLRAGELEWADEIKSIGRALSGGVSGMRQEAKELLDVLAGDPDLADAHAGLIKDLRAALRR